MKMYFYWWFCLLNSRKAPAQTNPLGSQFAFAAGVLGRDDKLWDYTIIDFLSIWEKYNTFPPDRACPGRRSEARGRLDRLLFCFFSCIQFLVSCFYSPA
jgi:hypothetical protein